MKRVIPGVALSVGLLLSGYAAGQDLPQAVVDLELSDIQIREKPRAEYGRRVRGSLPNGVRVEVDLDGDGIIEDVEARGNGLFPIGEIQSLVPSAISDNASWPTDAQLEKIEFERGGGIEIEGVLADGREFDAEFAADGRMLEFDIDD
ncbi:hypothetical protein [uncultured Nitratireductor sp.]|uniref:hypothetical protein n=1 Tax=uncultured Nitratireductor sp. TaxID=520953 RepID=UPI0025D11FB8|nr:hypothetical protein [uncultured Nitratireductor sp.]